MLRRMIALPAVVLTLLVSGAALISSSVADASDGGVAPAPVDAAADPFFDEGVYPPRLVVLDTDVAPVPAEVVLRNDQGREIPLTSPGVSSAAGVVFAHPPRLPEGVYELSYPDSKVTFEVGEPSARETAEVPAGSGRGLLVVLVLSVTLLPATFLLVRGQRRWAVALVVCGLAGGGALLVGAPRSAESALVAGDPCPVDLAELTACGIAYVGDVLEVDGLAAAWSEVERLAALSGSTWPMVCHEVAHDLGHRAFLVADSLAEAVNAGSSDCSLGYVHGLLEAAGTYTTDEEFTPVAAEICGLAAQDAGSEQSLFGCHHGVGHAAMWRFNQDFDRASATCTAFDLPMQRQECSVGTVMEWVNAQRRASTSGREEDLPAPKVPHPIELCEDLTAEMASGCVEGALSGALEGDMFASAQWCAPRAGIAEACARSLGRRLVQIGLAGDGSILDRAEELCSKFTNRSQCVFNMGYMHVFMSRDLPRTERFCAALSVTNRPPCEDGVQEAIRYAESIGDGSLAFGT